MEREARSVALIFQPVLTDGRRLAEECRKVVEAAGYEARLLSAWELSPAVDRSGLRLAMTFGGDGTIIRAARWLAGTNIPILGVGMGNLGFLTELPPNQACQKLPEVLSGGYWVDERLMLAARVRRLEDTAAEAKDGFVALNDVVIARGTGPRVVHLDVSVDGEPLVKYVADGLVLATPTGSTAYALAAGGPVVSPWVQALVMVPIAAHLTPLKSLVVPATSRIEVRATSEQPAVVIVDGQEQIPLSTDERVTVEAASVRTVFARTGSRTRFYGTLVQGLKRR